MRGLLVLFLFSLFYFPINSLAAVTEQCESAVAELFNKEISEKDAGEFLRLQGEITLHRLAWAYLKAQSSDSDDKAESIERTIIELLNDKYSNTDPAFIKAREAFESQPLSRSTLADVAPYLKDVLSAKYKNEDSRFVLNQSDLKLLTVLAKQERETALNGNFDHRMLKSDSPQGMLNFLKLINSSYKTYLNQSEKDLNVEVKLRGLENVLSSMQKRLSHLLDKLSLPSECVGDDLCVSPPSMANLFEQNSEIQKILWESLASSLESDDVLLDKLSYGDIWLKVKDATPKKVSVSKKSHPKKQTPTLVSNMGLVIEDPIGIIIRDKANRKRAGWKEFEKEFLNAMAEAVVNDDKVFLYKGKLHSRTTGKAITPEKALQLLPPKKGAEFLATLNSVDPKLRNSLAKAMVNGDKTFVLNNTLYNLKGKAQSPALIIAQVMSSKTGVKLEASRYKGMENGYLVARAHALKNNLPYFKHGNRTMESISGRDLSSPFRSLAYTDAKIDKTKRKIYENLSDLELIKNFHRDRSNKSCDHYGVIDKKSATFKIYSNNGSKVFESEVLVGAKDSDQRTRWTEYSASQRTASSSTGAGIFTVRAQDKNDAFNKKNFNNNILSFKDESDKATVFAIHQVPTNLPKRYSRFGTNDPDDRRISGGCANLKLSDFKAAKKWLGVACKVYVLPEEDNNKFIVQDNELKLVSTKPVPMAKTNLYNYSSNSKSAHPIDIKIVNKEGNTQAAREFVKALEDEKSKLMKGYNLSNDEYNDLAMLAYGILGNESSFGTSTKLMIKETNQFAVITARLIKSGSLDEAKNTSRGLTQIKYLPEAPFSKLYPEVSKANLLNPRNSAVATLAYLADAAKQMRQIALKNNEDPKKLRITRENMMDYMGYLYQGGRGSLSTSDKSEQATPEFNAYYRKLQLHMSYIEISQKIN